jgi:hypothetical protein
MKTFIVTEGKEFDNISSRTSRGISHIVLRLKDGVLETLPEYGDSPFVLLLYKKDSLSDVMIGCEKMESCKVVKGYAGDYYGFEVKESKREFFNMSEINKIRSERLNSFLGDSTDEN